MSANNIVRTASRAFLTTLAPALVAASSALAQLAPGDIVVSTKSGSPVVVGYQIIPVVGSPLPLGNVPAGMPETAFEIDPVSGDLMFAIETTAGIEVRRATIVANMINTNTLVLTLPNTVGFRPAYLHREASGGFLLLSRSNPGPGPQLLHRIGFTSASAVAYQVAQLQGGVLYTDLATAANGDVFMTGPYGTTTSAVDRVSFNGANFASGVFNSSYVRAYAIEIDAANNILMAGDARLAPPNDRRFHCSGGGVAFFAGQSCVDLHREAGTTTMLAAFNGGGAQSTVDRYSAACGSTWIAQLWAAPVATSLHKISQFVPDATFGYPRETLSLSVPVISQLGAPTIGGNWVVQVTGMTGQNPMPLALFTMGFNDVTWISGGGVPLPVDLTPSGFSRCAVFLSADASVAVSLNSGTAVQIVPIPNDPGFVGLQLFGQWSSFDGSTTACQSQALRAKI